MTHSLYSGHRIVLTISLVLVGLGVQAQDTGELTAETLTGHSFRFSWREGDRLGFNGILVLDRDGRVFGINSPNETSWEIDGQGRLLIRHADGRVSTTFETCEIRKGGYFFEGPFHLREGIVHQLEETGDRPAPPQPELAKGLPDRLLMTNQKIFCLDEGVDHKVGTP